MTSLALSLFTSLWVPPFVCLIHCLMTSLLYVSACQHVRAGPVHLFAVHWPLYHSLYLSGCEYICHHFTAGLSLSLFNRMWVPSLICHVCCLLISFLPSLFTRMWVLLSPHSSCLLTFLCCLLGCECCCLLVLFTALWSYSVSAYQGVSATPCSTCLLPDLYHPVFAYQDVRLLVYLFAAFWHL